MSTVAEESNGVDGVFHEEVAASEGTADKVEGSAEGDSHTLDEHQLTITVILPTPTYQPSYLVPPANKSQPHSRLTISTSSLDSLQEIRLQIQESDGGYWLGPYSFRIDVPSEPENGKVWKQGDVINTGRDNLEIRLGVKLSDWIELGEVFGGDFWTGKTEKVIKAVREPFSEADARAQVIKLDETLASGTFRQDPTSLGVCGGLSLYETVRVPTSAPAPSVNGSAPKDPSPGQDAFANFAGWQSKQLSNFYPKVPSGQTIACLKNMTLSNWNPPPAPQRQMGHLLYLSVNTLEGESVQLVCTVRGWYVSKSTSHSFDPSPRPSPKNFASHSLIDLLHGLSPLFTSQLAKLNGSSSPLAGREAVATAPIQQSLPSFPWISQVPAPSADPIRQQLAYLHTGATSPSGLDGARDWNDEIQQTREMPKSTMQEKIMREKLLARLHSEFTAVCVKGAIAISRGDILPLNPHEAPAAWMWLYHNVFFTKGVDSIAAFSHLGGDEAAHTACGKDAAGVRLLNQMDIDGACLLGHTVVDWAGERWVCQSFLPGIFKRRDEEPEVLPAPNAGDTEESETTADSSSTTNDASKTKDVPAKATDSSNQLIVYGSDLEAGPNVVRWDASFHSVMEKIAGHFRLALHDYRNGPGEGDKIKVWTSVDVKGLNGTDGRKYILDAFRLSPVDVEFLEKDLEGAAYTSDNVVRRVGGSLVTSEEGQESQEEDIVNAPAYPHRLVLLRTELIETFWDLELQNWANTIAAKYRESKAALEPAKPVTVEQEPTTEASEDVQKSSEEAKESVTQAPAPEYIVAANGEISILDEHNELQVQNHEEPKEAFKLAFNPDAFVETKPSFPKGENAPEDAPARLASEITDESDPSIKAVRQASLFLRTVAIPGLVLDFMKGKETCIDGVSLTKILHKKGINMRYLGMVAANVERFQLLDAAAETVGNLKSLLIIIRQEMVFRASKRLLRALLKDQLLDEYSAIISHFLNCLLSSSLSSSPAPEYIPSPFPSTIAPAWISLTPEVLQAQVSEEVARRFRYTLPVEYLSLDLKKPQILRELATRFAFQLAPRDYFAAPAVSTDVALTASSEEEKDGKKKKGGKKSKITSPYKPTRSSYFEAADILTLLPVVKTAEPSSTTAEQTLDSGRNMLARGNKAEGLEVVIEGIALYENINAVLHQDVARAYNAYAISVHSLVRSAMAEAQAQAEEGAAPPSIPEIADLKHAIGLQKNAVMISERVLGLDSHETLNYYYNLALLEHLDGNIEASLALFRHVLDLWDIVYGPGHPDAISVLVTVGQLLTQVSNFEVSSKVFETAYTAAVAIFGPDSSSVGETAHILSQNLFFTNQMSKSLSYSETANRIFAAKLPEDHPTRVEAQMVFEHFKKVQEQTTQSGTTAGPRKVPAAAASLRRAAAPRVQQPAPAPSEVKEKDSIATRGHLEVDYLAEYVNGNTPASSKKSKGSKKSKK